VRSDPFHVRNVQNLEGLFCKRELHACFLPSRLSKFDSTCKLGTTAQLTMTTVDFTQIIWTGPEALHPGRHKLLVPGHLWLAAPHVCVHALPAQRSGRRGPPDAASLRGDGRGGSRPVLFYRELVPIFVVSTGAFHNMSFPCTVYLRLSGRLVFR
jgi:hypothetical protein